MTDFLWTRPDSAPVATLLLAHVAGAAMDSPFMEKIAAFAAAEGIAVVRFEFPYMAERRRTGKKRPPPRADKLIDVYLTVISEISGEAQGPLLIGGKSVGERVAAMITADPALDAHVAGVVCLGYPFHAPGKTDALRLEPLQALPLPCLIAQGERDAFGNREEVLGYGLPEAIEVLFLEDGSHDLAPRGSSPATWDGNLKLAAKAIRKLADGLHA
ncbi:MAG: alpha/beta hydrolase [Breoghania sp.]|nr:alpha/beta family hydrolase [Breoghania sp.]MDJ0932913.1 alpha/beta hydrolase [Breoghania sp.]